MTRDAAPHESWTAEEWRAYRDRVLAYVERSGDQRWHDSVGRRLVAMADRRITRLDPDVLAR